MPSKSKPPITTRRVMADDIAVEQGGETYYPHVGEWVEFKGRPNVGLYLKISQLAETSEGIDMLVALMPAWNFTDDEGRAYPNPPTVDAVMRLGKEELAWLIGNVSTEGMSEAALKNAPTPST